MNQTDKSQIRRLAARAKELAAVIDGLTRNLTHADRAPQAVIELREAERRLLAAREAIEKAVSTAAV